MNVIRALPETLINQIAAGEVVERPASVIKELVENSLDAKAKRIEILLSEGGNREITVLDDGVGMTPQDLKLCVERHTTSKIREFNDLDRLETFGFRGEALSSIASVAEVEIRSRVSDRANGFNLSVGDGKASTPLAPVASPVGTCLTVKNLFARLPARQKFLRAAATELSHCARVVKELAVGSPEVAFTLRHEDRLLFSAAPATRQTRYQEAFKVEWTPLVIEESTNGIELTAVLSPGDLIQDRGEVLIYVNQRCVRNKVLAAALRKGYCDLLGPHHEPSGVLYLDMPSDWIDANVHPQKLEVRLARGDLLYGWVATLAKKVLAQKLAASPSKEALSQRPLQSPLFGESLDDAFPKDRTLAEFARPPALGAPSLRYFGQSKGSYLICEDEKGLIFVDPHGLDESLRFRALQSRLQQGPLESTLCQAVQVVRIPTELRATLEEQLDFFSRLGFDMEWFGDGDVAIKSRPLVLKEPEVTSFVLEALGDLERSKRTPRPCPTSTLDPLKPPSTPETSGSSVLTTLACRSAMRRGQFLTEAEVNQLLQAASDLSGLGEDTLCPHGQPVMFRLGFDAMAKHFERS